MKNTKNGDKDSTHRRPHQDANTSGTIRQMSTPILARLLSILTERPNLKSGPDASNIQQVRLLILIFLESLYQNSSHSSREEESTVFKQLQQLYCSEWTLEFNRDYYFSLTS